MKLHKRNIIKVADYIALNSCSATSNGLYDGKAGMSLALFELAHFLHDDTIETQALNTFQESLLSKTADMTFENGLPGIGYALLYLLQNKLLDAEFEEIFDPRLSLIYDYVDDMLAATNAEVKIRNMNIMYFLALHSQHTCSQRSADILTRLAHTCHQILMQSLQDFSEGKSNKSRYNLLLAIEKYIKIVDECAEHRLPTDIINHFVSAYESGRWMSRVGLSASLYNLSVKTENKRWQESAMQQLGTALRGVDVDKLSLQQLVDFLFYDLPLQAYTDKKREIREYLFTGSEQETTQRLIHAISSIPGAAGYREGMSRYLLCAIHECSDSENRQIIRPV